MLLGSHSDSRRRAINENHHHFLCFCLYIIDDRALARHFTSVNPMQLVGSSSQIQNRILGNCQSRSKLPCQPVTQGLDKFQSRR